MSEVPLCRFVFPYKQAMIDQDLERGRLNSTGCLLNIYGKTQQAAAAEGAQRLELIPNLLRMQAGTKPLSAPAKGQQRNF